MNLRRLFTGYIGAIGGPIGLGLVALFGASSAAWAKGKEPSCRVRYVTGKRAYLDVGASDGVQRLDNLPLTHNGRKIGTCTVDTLSDNWAMCVSDAASRGDMCQLLRAAPVATAPRASTIAAPVALGASDQAAVDRAIDAAPVDKVAFHGSGLTGTRGTPIVVASIGHSTYTTFDGSHYEQERIDLQLRGVSLRGGGFRAYAALTAILASVRPSEQRFRPDDVAQVYVWQTEFSSREVGRPFAFAIGRIWPRFAPGLSMLDGMQAGWRKKDGSVEVGVVGGTLPNASTLYPSYQRWLAGVYFGHIWNPRDPSGKLKMVIEEGRLDIRQTDKQGMLLETELSLMFSFGKRFDFATAARATLGGGSWTTPELEAARAHFTVRPIDQVRIAGSFRYLGKRASDYDGFGTFFSQGRQYYGTLDVVGDVSRWLSISVGGVVQHDEATGNGRQTVQGEVAFRNLPRRGGVVSVGYQEAFGWLRGHAAYLQYANSEYDRWRLMLRATYAEDLPIVGGDWHREVSANLYGEVRIIRWLSLRLSTLARVVVASPASSGGEGDEGGNRNQGIPGGVMARLDLIGSY